MLDHMELPIYREPEFAIIDEQDGQLSQYRWCALWMIGAHGYGVRPYYYVYRNLPPNEKGHKPKEFLHKAVLRLRGVEVPAGYKVCFKNKNPLDCRFDNLAVCPKSDPYHPLNIPPGRRLAKFFAECRAAEAAKSA